jgi:glycerophosphoryl diester phosphodiesterase
MPVTADRFLVFGHRGSPRRFAENTVQGFEETLRAGADGFETDLRLLADQTAVLFHDDELDDDAIESLSSATVAERGRTVELLRSLAPFAQRATMILEVKRGHWEDALLAEIGNWPQIVVASFDHSAIAELARRNVPFDLGITVFGYPLDLANYAKRLRVTWCFPGYHYVDEALVDALHAENIRVVPWTPNRVREWERLRALGCDGVITDLPAECVAWRDGAAVR